MSPTFEHSRVGIKFDGVQYGDDVEVRGWGVSFIPVSCEDY